MTHIDIRWKVGFEVELVAPRGRSRRDLAVAVAESCGGTVRPTFHLDAEPSQVPKLGVFHHLTPAFEVLSARRQTVATVVDDVTLQADLDPGRPGAPGWFRIVSDDIRLLRLVQRHARADAPLEQALDAVASLFGTKVRSTEQDLYLATDEQGAPVAIACPVSGERERAAELITAPLETEHEQTLQAMLDQAARLGFGAPVEGAVHVHFDGTRLRDGRVLARLVAKLHSHRHLLRALVGTNPACRRLGAWPARLLSEIHRPAFSKRPWDEVRQVLRECELTRYCDFNLLNLTRDGVPPAVLETPG